MSEYNCADCLNPDIFCDEHQSHIKKLYENKALYSEDEFRRLQGCAHNNDLLYDKDGMAWDKKKVIRNDNHR